MRWPTTRPTCSATRRARTARDPRRPPFGGLLTYYVAANHSDRVEKAVVLDAPTRSTSRSSTRSRFAARLERTFASWEEYDALVRSFPYWDGFAWTDEIQASYRGDAEELPDGTIRPRCNPAHIRAVIDGELEVDRPATRAACA